MIVYGAPGEECELGFISKRYLKGVIVRTCLPSSGGRVLKILARSRLRGFSNGFLRTSDPLFLSSAVILHERRLFAKHAGHHLRACFLASSPAPSRAPAHVRARRPPLTRLLSLGRQPLSYTNSIASAPISMNFSKREKRLSI